MGEEREGEGGVGGDTQGGGFVREIRRGAWKDGKIDSGPGGMIGREQPFDFRGVLCELYPGGGGGVGGAELANESECLCVCRCACADGCIADKKQRT